ncbi:hypothetical protein NRB16_12550 [Pseudomonas sp. LJDD11]|uniref:hypothetical protein n=1 Tax=Pseudomonas sp. LJDD11 TaxID=2931984 RepID=UPI00211CEE51|nr:hypothetical protein [Pseudomonas sp. LJDD11]MCQ9424344.1 hypothetical protein [Pseudomonas sp. LJDD11]
MTDPSAAATSTNAAIANVDNNWLATQQIIQYKKEYNEAKTPQEKVAVFLKWEKTSLDQDVLTGVGIAKGFKDGMAGIGVDTLNSAVSMLRDPQAHIDAVIAFVDSPEVRDRLKQHIHAQLREKLEKIDQALEHGGDENAEMLGKMMGEVTAVVISTVSTGGGGAATKSATLSEMGILISGKKLEQLATTVKLEKVTENFAQTGKPGRDPDVPFVETVTTAGKTVDQIEIPSWYKEDSSAGAMLARPANLPEGSRVFVNTKTGNVEVLIPEKGLHVVRGEGGLEVKDGGRLANLKAAEANIAEAQKTNSSVEGIGEKGVSGSTLTRDELISGLSGGTKITPENVVDIRRLPDGRTVWLEKGTDAAGLQHIYKRHEVDFVNKGISRNDIPTIVMNALERGDIIGTNGSANVYRVTYNGVEQNIAVGVGSNGFVVRANPVSFWKPLP